MTTFHVLNVNANCSILEIGLTYLLAVITEAILKLTEPKKISEHFYKLAIYFLIISIAVAIGSTAVEKLGTLWGLHRHHMDHEAAE